MEFRHSFRSCRATAPLAAAFIAFALLLPVSLFAQAAHSGSLTGEVRESETAAPLGGCRIRATAYTDSTDAHVTFSNSKGAYRFSDLTVGEYHLTYSLLGYKRVETRAKITADEPTSLMITLTPEILPGGDLIVTASRREEKVTEAPASISVVGARQIAITQAPTVTHLLSAVPGMDISQEGVFAQSYASRSANSVYSSDLYTMIDNRSLAVPGIGGYFGLLMPISNFDIDHIEVVRGPGAALYGPGASEGVAHIITLSPFSSQGTSVAIAGGEREYMDAQLRHAMSLSDKLAFKVSGTYRKVHDWEYTDSAEVAARDLVMSSARIAPADTAKFYDTVRVGHRQPNTEFYTVDGRVDYAIADNSMLMINAGTTEILKAVQMTSAAGGAQVDGWTMGYGQARFTWSDLFVEGHYQKVNTSNTYILQTGDPVAEASSTIGVEAQHHAEIGESEFLTYGADYTSVSPKNSVAYGVNSGNVTSNVVGGYVQSKTSIVTNALDLTLAARIDKQTEFKDILFSPRAALVAHFGEGDMHTVRAMFNQTVTPPGVDAFYYDVNYKHNVFGLPVAQGIDLRLEGVNSSGTHFSMVDGGYTMYSPFAGAQGFSTNSAVSTLWPVIQNIAAANIADTNLAKAFKAIPAPPAQVVGSYLAMFDGVGGFRPLTSGPEDIPEVKPQGHQVLELDYQAKISDAVQVEIDGYRSHYDNYPALRQPVTPNVFINGTQLQGYYNAAFRAGGLDSATAGLYSTLIATQLAKVPLGTVSPDGSAHPMDLLYGVPAYYGDVNYYGLDLSTALKVSDRVSLDAGLSMVSDNMFTPDDSTRSQIYLNIPKYKGSLGIHYIGLLEGLNADVRYRWSDAFTMRSGIEYFGDVSARNLIDLTLAYSNATFRDLVFTLSITNLLDYKHEEFIGAPYIGRFTTLKASYTLPSL
jgi:outer membrane receptor for ferrienterochelin and colicins